MKYFILDTEKVLNEVLDYLVGEIGFPSIQRRLNMYPEDDNGTQLQAVNSQVFFRDHAQGKFVHVKNKNLKHLFAHIDETNKKGFIINDIVILEFPCANILFDTFHGNILATEDEEFAEKFKSKFPSLESYSNINDHKALVTEYTAEPIFDEVGNLNSKLKNYSNKTGLDIRSASGSVRLRLSNLSNDYSHIETYFKMITNTPLLSFSSEPTHADKFKPISIVIPVYNQDVTYTLLAIQGQNLSKEQKEKIQVIVVDDGSKDNVADMVQAVRGKLDYEVSVITFDSNKGLSTGRNAGISLAKHDFILFLDSDIIISKNFLYDINIRLQIVPNAIFVAMRRNIPRDSEMLDEAKLLKGIEPTLDFDDSRVTTHSKSYHIGWDKAFIGEKVSVLDDTNYFKQLGFGSKVGIYDLSTVVTGHNMAINRSMIYKYPVFSTRFKGWGMEDAYFASTLISNGCFVIPVMSSCVYHIEHLPHSGSMEQKAKEAAANYELYNQMLDEKWEE